MSCVRIQIIDYHSDILAPSCHFDIYRIGFIYVVWPCLRFRHSFGRTFIQEVGCRRISVSTRRC
jgi:hypothetical protein